MLRFEKLSLQGFKSFCDQTEVAFDEEGITAVVGPNGCGKSNVADAISWVIGEQRAKALRGGKMEDVIFQGSRSRQPAGMAEVILTLVVRESFEVRGESLPESEALKQAEESLTQAEAAVGAIDEAVAVVEADQGVQIEGSTEPQTALPEPAQAPGASLEPPQRQSRRRVKSKDTSRVFQAGERITVARRLYRTGESEYEMNGRAARLRDIQDLFAGTGLGAAHYAIIEQGRIGQVLSAKPLDRRALIEEAAGVSKFKMRQHAAELKLEASKQNLARVSDIIAEIERQQNSLKRQAARARRYKRLRQEMRDLMRAVYVVDYRSITETLAVIETILNEVSTREAQLAALIAEREAAQGQASRLSRVAEEDLNKARDIASGLGLEIERTRQQQIYLTEQIQSVGARSAQFIKDQAAITERGGLIAQEITRLREELQRTEHEINVESRTLTDEESRHQVQAQSDSESEHKLEETRKAVYDFVTHLERWRQLKRQFEDSVDRGRSRLSGLAVEYERSQTQAQAAEDRLASLAGEVENTHSRQEETASSLANISAGLAESRASRDALQVKLSALQLDMTGAEQRLRSLVDVHERRAYFSEAVQILMKRSSHNNGQFNEFSTLGTLADFVKVSPEFEEMIEAALRDELQYVVVPSFDDALRAIDYLKSEDAGRATFLIVEPRNDDRQSNSFSQSGNGDPSYSSAHSYTSISHNLSRYQTLDSMLGLNPDLAEAFELALPGLAKARVVNDAKDAIQSSSSSNGLRPYVSLARTGERAIAGRLVTGGSASEKGLGVLALKREISSLQAGIELQRDEVRKSEAELNEINSQIVQTEESQKTLDGELRQIEKQLVVLREQLQQCERDRERAVTHIRVVEKETAQAEDELSDFEAKFQHASQKTNEAEEAHQEAERVIASAQSEMAELRRGAEIRVQELSRRRADFAAKTERRRGLQNDIRRLETEAGDLESRVNRINLEAVEADNQLNSTRASLIETIEQFQRLTAQVQLHSMELEKRVFTLATERENLETLDLELRSAREAATQAREQRAYKEVEKARLTSDMNHLIQSCQTELGENIAEICARLEFTRRSAETHQSTSSTLPSLSPDDQHPESVISLSDAGNGEKADEEDDEREVEITFWQVPEGFDLGVAKTQLDDIRKKIDALGPVNMMALDELSEVEDRFDFLVAQKTDIEKAITHTQSAIAEIKRRSRERFVEAFNAINENFKRMFVELFGGGHGEMRLIDETDILESGIEIIAQPPGKRLQNVLLLSGGEKAMAALSLVMAIFKYRPSPFCLLDEVDAPLDDVNIGRFSEKVIEMSADTQFMIITHSKRTMEIARTLYGVTMEDPGVSKLISVRLS